MKIEVFNEEKKVFVSYVRENSAEIDKICSEFTKYDIEYWLDRKEVIPGKYWKEAIREAIKNGAYFLACFSEEYENRTETHMNEELLLAIDILRKRSFDSGWFIPIKLSECKIPDMDIGAGKTLNDIHCLKLFEEWESRLDELINVIIGTQPTAKELTLNSLNNVEVFQIDFTDDEEESMLDPNPLIIRKRLRNFGFQVKLGSWDSSRLLSKLAPESKNSLYVIHHDNPELSDRIVRTLRNLKIAPRIVTLSTKEVETSSTRLEAETIVEYADAIVAYRAVV